MKRFGLIPITPALAERSEAWTLIGDLTGEGKTACPKARSDAERAVAIAPELAEAHAALGWAHFFTEWKLADGLKEAQRAKELSPANPTANDLLARIYVYLAKLTEAEKHARQAVEFDPLSHRAQNNLARVLYCEDKLDEADAVARKAVELQPSAGRATDSRSSLQLNAAMARERCAKRNWNPTKIIAVSNWP